MTEERLRIFTYVILGVALGVILAAIVIDIKFSAQTAEAIETTQEPNKENHHHESNTTRIEQHTGHGA